MLGFKHLWLEISLKRCLVILGGPGADRWVGLVASQILPDQLEG